MCSECRRMLGIRIFSISTPLQRICFCWIAIWCLMSFWTKIILSRLILCIQELIWIFRDVVGMLEHDPASVEPKKHREFLFEKSKFKDVLPIKTDDLKNKIQLTYRVQYVHDVCLPAPSLFEENLLTCMSSRLFFSRAEIVNSLIVSSFLIECIN